MNAHNEQLLISSLQAAATGNTTTLKMMELCGAAAKALSSNPTNQPAAAQEAVAYWRVTFRMYPENRDCCETFVRRPDRPTLDTLGISPRPVQITSMEPYFAAPVTAAPAELIERCKEILAWQRTGVLPGDALRAYANARWPDEHDPLQIAEKETAREAFRILARAAAASTPAAPGIDLTPFRELADAWQKESSEALGQFPPIEGNHRSQMIRLGKCATKLHNLIDASPKGDDVAGTLRLLLDERNHRTDGDLKTLAARCLHLSRGDRDLIAMRGALIEKLQQRIAKDSPKGGSEAPTYTTGHCENHKKPGGCPLHNLQCGYPQCDRKPASDAEVRP